MKKTSIILFLALARVLGAADTAYSPPVGGMTIVVPAGQTRSIALPLVHESAAVGATLGRIDAVGSNYIEDTTANWVGGELSSAANPYYLRIKTGAAAGRVLMVSTTANTSTRVFLSNDGTDLTTAGIATGVGGDVYELVLADTLGDLFGGWLQGGGDAATADNVQVWSNTAWITYYFNTVRSRWERSTDTGASPDRSNVPLRPDRGVMITRRAVTELRMPVVGRAPDTGARYVHSRPGVTFLSLGTPKDITLGDLSVNTVTNGWLASVDATTALSGDYIQLWNNTAWLTYYYDSTKGGWQRSTDTGASPSRNAVPIPAGRPMLIRRAVSSASNTLINIPLNYAIAR
jgi:hypothetical protein